MISLGGVVLMSSQGHASEDALCLHGLAGAPSGARVLVGGLGLGFTLRAVLDRVGPAGRVTVSELSPAVLRWNRERFPHLSAGAVDDPRVTVCLGDVGALLGREGEPYDAVLLDVDNGPVALSSPSNVALYSAEGLRKVRRSLAPKGALALWSAGPDPGFEARLAREGFRVEAHRVATRPRSSGGAVVLVGRRGG